MTEQVQAVQAEEVVEAQAEVLGQPTEELPTVEESTKYRMQFKPVINVPISVDFEKDIDATPEEELDEILKKVQQNLGFMLSQMFGMDAIREIEVEILERDDTSEDIQE